MPPKPPEEPGPAKTYGGDACRAAAYRRRHCRPLGSELIAQMGIEDRSPLEMLREQEIVDLADLAVVDAWIVAQRHR